MADRTLVYRKGAPGPGVRRVWAAGQSSLSGGRLAREGFVYYAFDGWPIKEVGKTVSAELGLDLTEAETEVRRLNDDPPRTELLEAVARQLLRSEAVASSRIEGLELSHRKLAEAAFDPESTTINARSVLGNVRAMDEAIRLGSTGRDVTVSDIRTIHRTLFAGTRDDAIGGVVRDRQNWIGGRDNPWGAAFIPVPEDQVEPLLRDLCRFASREDLSPIAQAAIAHAQFETIHPFSDGNGRVGRALIHLVLRRRGVAPHYVPPISVVLAANYREYERGLTLFRESKFEEWCGLFARAVTIAARGAGELARRIEGLKGTWREQAGHPRAGSAAAKLIDLLPGQPVVDVRTVEEALGISDEAARLGIDRLASAGVLVEVTKRKRGRAWECVGLFALFDSFEGIVATPAGSSVPLRRVPRATRSSARVPASSGPGHLLHRALPRPSEPTNHGLPNRGPVRAQAATQLEEPLLAFAKSGATGREATLRRVLLFRGNAQVGRDSDREPASRRQVPLAANGGPARLRRRPRDRRPQPVLSSPSRAGVLLPLRSGGHRRRS